VEIESIENYSKIPTKTVFKARLCFENCSESLNKAFYDITRNGGCVLRAEREMQNSFFVQKTERKTKIETKTRGCLNRTLSPNKKTVKQPRFGH
jgi:hypothetical protein